MVEPNAFVVIAAMGLEPVGSLLVPIEVVLVYWCLNMNAYL